MDRDNYTGVTDEEFQVAVNAVCDRQDVCDHGYGCRCSDAQLVAGDTAWVVLNAVHKYRTNS